jgi:hypothetical protein
MLVSNANRHGANPFRRNDARHPSELPQDTRVDRSRKRHGQVLTLFAAKRFLEVRRDRIPTESPQDQERHRTRHSDRGEERTERPPLDLA